MAKNKDRQVLSREEFDEIMDKDDNDSAPSGNCTLNGLNLIAKYLPKSSVEAAEHDIIYSAGVDELLEAGLTRGDAEKLRKWNWHVEDEEHLAKFV